MNDTNDSITTQTVLAILKTDPRACELKWALFTSCLASYKRESLLRPFPSRYREDDKKDFTGLEEVVKSIPSLTSLSAAEPGGISLSDDQVYLLNWVLNSKQYSIKSLDKGEFDSVIRPMAGHTVDAPAPDYVFQVINNDASEEKFQSLKTKQSASQHSSGSDLASAESTSDNSKSKASLFAYHGSQLCNFHSILNHGLISNLNKTSLFGEGTYLSNELCVCFNWSPAGSVGPIRSRLGDRLNCIAVCEVINDPSDVSRCYDETSDSSSMRRNSSRPSFVSNKVPEKYLVVKNDMLVQVRYLLVYAHFDMPRSSGMMDSSVGVIQRWLWDNRAWLVLFFYAFILVFVGLANSRDFKFYIKRMTNYWWHHPSPTAYDDYDF